MRQFSNILILLLLLLGIIACKTTESSSTGEAAQTQVKPNTGPTDEERLSLTRFDEAIAAFEAADKTAPPPANAFLFVGSSSIRKWETLAEDLAPLPVINRGFGGSTMPQLNHYADRIVFPYKPRGILVYEGDNDITVSSMTPEKVLRNVRSFFERVQKELPGIPVWFIAVKPSVARLNLLEKGHATNRLMQQFADEEDLFSYIDISTPMLGEDGKPMPDIFIEDNLHMNAKGYEIWTAVIKPILMEASAE